MKYQPGLFELFISPVTGLHLEYTTSLDNKYIWVGDKSNRPQPSPALIDLKLEIINLKTPTYILQSPHQSFMNAQALNQLPNGILNHVNGVVGIQELIPPDALSITHNMLLTGDEDNRAIEVQRIKLLNLPSFLSTDPTLLLGAYNLWTGDPNPLNLGNPIQVKTLNLANMADLEENHFWLGNISGRPEPVLFEINTGTGLIGGPINGSGTISIGDTGVIPGTYPYATLTVNAQGQLTEANGNEDILDNIADEISDILDQLGDIYDQLTDINSQLTDINTQLGDINTQLGDLVIALDGALAGIADLIAGLAAVNDRIDNLRLNHISADGDVSFYNYKLINLADPTNPTDGVNLRTLSSSISTAIGDLRLNNISVDGDVNMSDYKITNLADGTDPGDAANVNTVNTIVAAAIADSIGEITLEGFVIGGPPDPDTGVITTDRGFTDLDMLGYRVKNINQSPVENLDAISAQFLWDLMHDEVGVTWL